jgi:hypothetical protein
MSLNGVNKRVGTMSYRDVNTVLVIILQHVERKFPEHGTGDKHLHRVREPSSSSEQFYIFCLGGGKACG